MDDRLAEAASELGITKGDLLLMTRLAVFVEGPHDVIILREWFGDELRDAGIRVFRHTGQTTSRITTHHETRAVGSEIIGAMGIRIAVISDKRITGGETTTKRICREGGQARPPRCRIDLLIDILFYLDEQVCREFTPNFPGWRAMALR